MYFRSLIKSVYSFKDKGIENIPSIDIMKRFVFVEDTELSNMFYYYDVQDGETPELIAEKIYGSPYWYWLILLYNDITDPFEQFTRKESYIEESAVLDLGNYSVFYIEEDGSVERSLTVGDILIRFESDGKTPYFDCDDDVISSQVVNLDYSTNKYTMYDINGSTDCSVSSFSATDKVGVISKREDGTLYLAFTGTLRRTEDVLSSLNNFENANLDIVGPVTLSPASSTHSTLATKGGFQEPEDNTLGDTIIGDYMGAAGSGDFGSYSSYEAVSFLDHLRRSNDLKRRIKIPHPAIKNKIQKELSTILTKPSFDSDILVKNN